MKLCASSKNLLSAEEVSLRLWVSFKELVLVQDAFSNKSKKLLKALSWWKTSRKQTSAPYRHLLQTTSQLNGFCEIFFSSKKHWTQPWRHPIVPGLKYLTGVKIVMINIQPKSKARKFFWTRNLLQSSGRLHQQPLVHQNPTLPRKRHGDGKWKTSTKNANEWRRKQ